MSEEKIKPKSLKEALFEIQRRAPKIQRIGFNPHTNSKFMQLDDVYAKVLELLTEYDVLWSCRVSYAVINEQAVPILKYSFLHVPTNQEEADAMLLMLPKASPQDQGSGITFARRYALVTALNLVTDKDDDGQAATNAADAAHNKATRPPQTAAPAARTAVQTGPDPAAQAKLRESIAEMSGLLKKNYPEHWEKVLNWATQQSIDMGSPAVNKLRSVEGALRRKLEAIRGTEAKAAAAAAKKADENPAKDAAKTAVTTTAT